MDKLVKIKATNEYAKIADTDFDSNIHIDRSDKPAYWYHHHKEAGFSYWQARYRVRLLVEAETNGFSDFRDPDKDILGIFGLGDQSATVAFYMAHYGMDQATASGFLVLRLSENTAKLAEDARVIVHSPRIMQIGIKYLTWIDQTTGEIDSTQANNLTYAIQGFLTEYERYAVVGLNYGDEREGIMDYMESTNSYASGGLKNYTFSPDMIALHGTVDAARLAMIVELQEVFVKGNI